MLERYLSEDEIQMIRDEGFDQRGLRYTLTELNTISPVNKSIKDMSKYVDAITFVMVQKGKNDLLKEQLQELREGERVNISITGLGNLAFTALHSTDNEVREKALKIYYQIINGRQQM